MLFDPLLDPPVDVFGLAFQLALTAFLSVQLGVCLLPRGVMLSNLLSHFTPLCRGILLGLFGGLKLVCCGLAQLLSLGFGLVSLFLGCVQAEPAFCQLVQFQGAGAEQCVGELCPLIYVSRPDVIEKNRQLGQGATLLGDDRDLFRGAGIHGIIRSLGSSHVCLSFLRLSLSGLQLSGPLGIEFLGLGEP